MLALAAFAVVVRIITNPLANVFQKQLTLRLAHPLFVTCATYGLLTVACLVATPSLFRAGLPVAFWPKILTCCLLSVLGNVFLVRAMHLGDLSVLGPINAYKAVVSVLVGVVVLGEIPGWVGLAGIGLMVVGSYVVLSQSGSGGWSWSIFNQPEVRLRLMALVFSGIDGVFLKRAIQLSTPEITFVYWCLLGFCFSLFWLLLTQWKTSPVQVRLLIRHWPLYLGLVTCAGLMQLSTNTVFQQFQVGYALALFQLSALLSVLFGHFFNEKGLLRKLIGAFIMVAGAAIILLFP